MFPYIGKISQLTFMFFRWVGIPPTSTYIIIYHFHQHNYGKSHFLMGNSHFFMGKSSFFFSRESPLEMGKSQFFMGKSPFLMVYHGFPSGRQKSTRFSLGSGLRKHHEVPAGDRLCHGAVFLNHAARCLYIPRPGGQNLLEQCSKPSVIPRSTYY